MIKIDIDKVNSYNMYAIVRGGFGKENPLLISLISKIHINDDGFICGLDYYNPIDSTDHWCYGHQIDNIVYTSERERFIQYCACGNRVRETYPMEFICDDCKKLKEQLLKDGGYTNYTKDGYLVNGYLVNDKNETIHILQIKN